MSKALVTRSGGSRAAGVVPAVASGFVPGLGQLLNGEGEKALGVFVVAGVAGLGFWSSLPLIGAAAGVIGGLTWIYGVADGYLTGKKKG